MASILVFCTERERKQGHQHWTHKSDATICIHVSYQVANEQRQIVLPLGNVFFYLRVSNFQAIMCCFAYHSLHTAKSFSLSPQHILYLFFLSLSRSHLPYWIMNVPPTPFSPLQHSRESFSRPGHWHCRADTMERAPKTNMVVR